MSNEQLEKALCRYTSAAFYDGKLHGVHGLGRQEILGWASGPALGDGC